MPMHITSSMLDPFEARALIQAAEFGSIETIDEITDRLAEQGVCRPRSDDSRMGEWLAMRQPSKTAAAVAHVAADVVATSIGSQIAQQLRGVFAGAAQ